MDCCNLQKQLENRHPTVFVVAFLSCMLSLIISYSRLYTVFAIYELKLQSVSFASLSPSLFANLQLQLFAELSTLRGVVHCCG